MSPDEAYMPNELEGVSLQEYTSGGRSYVEVPESIMSADVRSYFARTGQLVLVVADGLEPLAVPSDDLDLGTANIVSDHVDDDTENWVRVVRMCRELDRDSRVIENPDVATHALY